jgi:pilus assembly protein CpaB
MGRRTVLLITAVLIAAVGTTLILLYVKGIDSRATAAQQPVQVLTATGQIEAGESMAEAQEAGKVDLQVWPKSKVLATAVSTAEDFKNRVAISTVFPGEQIIPEKFGNAGDQDVLSIPKEKLAISVELTDPSRVAGFVSPGSDVAIFWSNQPDEQSSFSAEPMGQLTKLLLRKVEVIGVGQTTVLSTTKTTVEGEETTEEIPKTILTIAVTQKEAEKVILGTHSGELAFGLLTDDSITADSGGTDLSELYAGSNGAGQ